MADDKTTKTPEQPVTDTGPGKETPPTPPKEPEKVSVSPELEKILRSTPFCVLTDMPVDSIFWSGKHFQAHATL